MKRLDQGLLVGVVVLLIVTSVWPTARRSFVLQARLVLGVPPGHPHFVSPWRRPGSCTIYIEPRMDATREDYEWLARRHPSDWRVCLAAAAATPSSDRLARRAAELAPDEPLVSATLLACRLSSATERMWLKPKRGVSEAIPTRALPPTQVQPLLVLIAAGESEGGGNAYWPVMRMAIHLGAGEFGAAEAALRDAAASVAYRNFDGQLSRMVAEAWATEGVPPVASLWYTGPAASTWGDVICALYLMSAHAAFSERSGDTRKADAIYENLLDVAALSLERDMRPRMVSRVLETRAEILAHGELVEDLFWEERIRGHEALRRFVDAVRGRGRADLARHAVACARIENRVAAEQEARPDGYETILRLALFADLAWWPQLFLIPSAALLCVGGICGRWLGARWGRLRAARRGALLALPVLVAVSGAELLLWGLHLPEYGFGPGPSRFEIIAGRVGGVLLCLLPVALAVLAWRLGWKAPVHAVAQGIRGVGGAGISLGLMALVSALVLGLGHAWICHKAMESALNL